MAAGRLAYIMRTILKAEFSILVMGAGVALQVEQRKQSALQVAHPGQAGGCLVLPLALPARVDDEGLLDSTQLLQNAVEAQWLTLTGQFAL